MLITGLLVWASVTSATELPIATNLTLTAAVDLAVRDNTNLKSLRARWEAMQERPAQAGALPNPMFSYSGMDMASGGTWPDTTEKRFMIQQEFPWRGKRGLREGIALKDAEALHHELNAMTLDIVMMVKERVFDLCAVQQVIRLLREEDAVIRRLVKVTETLYATGARSQVDVLKAHAEITLLKQKLLETQAQENTLKAKLNSLLNRRADAPLELMLPPPATRSSTDVNHLYALALANRSEIQAAQTQVERYDLERNLIAKDSLPDYKLGLEYRDIEASDSMLMFSISLDLPIRRAKYRAGVREAEKMKISSEAARETAEQQSAFDVQDAHFKLLTTQRTLDLYRTELIPQATARLDASEAGYRTGQVDFMDLLESERFLLNAKMMAVMAEGSEGMLAARLERAIGAEAAGGTANTKPK